MSYNIYLILGNIKTNGLITLYKYPIKYLKLFFLSTNFEMTISLISTSQMFAVFSFAPQNSSFAAFVSPNLNIITI